MAPVSLCDDVLTACTFAQSITSITLGIHMVEAVRAPDDVLSSRLLAGDDQALAEIFSCHAALVFGVARRITGSTAMAEDVVQEVFCGLWSHPQRYDPARGSLRSYLGMAAHRRALDAVRADARRLGREQRADALEGPQEPEDPSSAGGAAWDQSIRRAVDALPEDQRRVVELAFCEGLTHTEVAGALRIPEGTVKSRLRLARSKLVRSLADLSPEIA